MRLFVVSPFAAEDLNQIWSYLANEADQSRADATLQRLAEQFAALAEQPGMGHLRQDLTSLPLHFFTSRPYLIIYSRDTSPLAIHAVVHASRNVRSLLRKRSLS